MSGSLGEEARWGDFGTRVAALGVHSVVSLPLRLGSKVVGAVTVEQAVGVLIAREGLDADAARRRLSVSAQERGERVSVVAAALVADAVRRTSGGGPTDQGAGA